MPDEAKARESALRFLARRDHSRAELRRKLVQKGFSHQMAESAIEYLADKGYLDDRRFAERWAASALESGRCYGPRLRSELRQRGVDPSVVSEVIAELTYGNDESKSLELLVSRKFPEFSPLTADEKSKRRLFAFLQRRGFPASSIFSFFNKSSKED